MLQQPRDRFFIPSNLIFYQQFISDNHVLNQNCYSNRLSPNKSRKMSDRKAVIKNADMSEEMQQDAVDCATQALEKYNIEKVCSTM